ncbi:hypothetical protein FB45DRAFT_909854 [Roridomyces roridus]|uniref:Chromo domain-containing protein n=1 Tax=Roridomyces roridus TaxID=1738132 RepID=A0AAD7BZ72_9AGAR|nr:hypothetical protein FB45DRAFT_909854 [Roridomyces roridus]
MSCRAPPQVPYQPLPDPLDRLAQALTQCVSEEFQTFRTHNDARMSRLEASIDRLNEDLVGARDEARTYVPILGEVLATSHKRIVISLNEMGEILGRVDETLKQNVDKLNRATFSVEELIQILKDPKANDPPTPLHHDMATSPFKQIYANAPRTPSPSPHRVVTLRSEEETSFFTESTLCVDEGAQTPDRAKKDDVFSPEINFAIASPVSRPLVPADWQSQVPSPVLLFNDQPLNDSPLHPPSPLPEGSVASLRLALETSGAAPVSHTPQILAQSLDDIGTPLSPAAPLPDRANDTIPSTPRRSRSRTVEAEQPQSPSNNSFREELSVLNLVNSPHSDIQPAQTRDVSVVPSSVTPSPLFGAQTSPPRLAISIPTAVPEDVCDAFMSPMSPLSDISRFSSPEPGPSTSSQQAGPSRRKTSGLTLATQTKAVASSRDALTPVSEEIPPVPLVKKRKPKTEPAHEPPLKRARQQAGLATVKQEERGKMMTGFVKWPALMQTTDPEIVGKFVGCGVDKCQRWFHCSCVGIAPGDPRLDLDGPEFKCPFCVANQPGPPNPGVDGDRCARPNCPIPTTDELFEPVGVYGHFTKLDSTYGRIEKWLILWKGYPFPEATWEPASGAPGEMIKEFEKKARGERLDPRGEEVVMLDEAIRGGARHPYQI